MENNQGTVDLQLDQHFESASKGQRFGNYVIDTIIFYVIFFILMAIFGALGFGETLISEDSAGAVGLLYLMIFGILIFYYSFMEFKFGKTVGKMLTKTKVINENGLPLTFKTCLLRTLSRIVPIEALSIFFGSDGRMWHDSWTDTWVVKDSKF